MYGPLLVLSEKETQLIKTAPSTSLSALILVFFGTENVAGGGHSLKRGGGWGGGPPNKQLNTLFHPGAGGGGQIW